MASKQLGIGLITAGEFMTNQPHVPGGAIGGDPLPGDPYAQMKLLFDATRVTGGTGNVVVTATDPTGLVHDNSANGPQVNSDIGDGRSEERRGGKGCVSQCRARWSPCHIIKKKSKK